MTSPERVFDLAVDMTMAAAALGYVSRDPDAWGSFLAYAHTQTGTATPDRVTRENACAASGRLAAIGDAAIHYVMDHRQ